MGADLFTMAIPAPIPTQERRQLLDQLIKSLTSSDLLEYPDLVDAYGREYDPEDPEKLSPELVDQIQEELAAGVNELWALIQCGGHRYCYLTVHDGIRRLFCGGESWGDEPFEGWDLLRQVHQFERIDMPLLEWASLDYHHKLEEQTQKQTLFFIVQLPVSQVGSGPVERQRLINSAQADPAQFLTQFAKEIRLVDYPREMIPAPNWDDNASAYVDESAPSEE